MRKKDKGDVSQQPTVLPTSTSTPLPVLKTTTAFTQTYMTVNFNTNTEQPEVPPTQNPGSRLDLPSSNLTPLSHHPETSPVPQQPQSANSEISDASKETNSINDIFTEDEKLFNINERTISPEVENHKTIPSVTPEQTESQGTPHKETDAFLEGTLEDGDKDGSFGLAPWKIGVISAAVFLATEAIVLTIYCLICRKRRYSLPFSD
ncbi:uncharacterized protein LOC134914273 [Pseudophryne corroboree]|uniref:uncharacterized protein LOC134914273 n=1 Tax=Pseudophryne corroboree TaxID=495146 RepID=UPI003081FECE